MNKDLVNLIINKGVFKQPERARDAWALGLVTNPDSEGMVVVRIDGDTNTTVMISAVPVALGDRVLTCLLGRARMVVANLAGVSGSLTGASLGSLIESLSAASVASADALTFADADDGSVAKKITYANLLAAISAGLVGDFAELESVGGSWSPTWSFSGGSISSVSGADYATLQIGKLGICWWNADSFTLSGSSGYNVAVDLPSGWVLDSNVVSGGVVGIAYAATGTAYQCLPVMLYSADSKLSVTAITAWTTGSGRILYGAVAVVPLA